MANDIVGGPEPIIINHRVLWFSPLNDVELSELEAWVSWRLEKRTPLYAGEALEELSSNVGAIQLLYQSVKRTKPMSVEDAAFVLHGVDGELDEVECLKVYDFWFELNLLPTDDAEVESTVESTATRLSDDELKRQLYAALALRFGWDANQVRLLTPVQQNIYLASKRPKSDVIEFATEAEALAYQIDLQCRRANGK